MRVKHLLDAQTVVKAMSIGVCAALRLRSDSEGPEGLVAAAGGDVGTNLAASWIWDRISGASRGDQPPGLNDFDEVIGEALGKVLEAEARKYPKSSKPHGDNPDPRSALVDARLHATERWKARAKRIWGTTESRLPIALNKQPILDILTEPNLVQDDAEWLACFMVAKNLPSENKDEIWFEAKDIPLSEAQIKQLAGALRSGLAKSIENVLASDQGERPWRVVILESLIETRESLVSIKADTTEIRHRQDEILAFLVRDAQSAPPAPIRPPAPLQTLAGRKSELDAALKFLKQKKSIAIVGDPGIGKTSLAREALRANGEVDKEFKGRLFWVECGTAATQNDLILACASACAVETPGRQPREILAAVCAVLAQGPSVCCLDNLETALDGDEPGVNEALSYLRASSVLVATKRGPHAPAGDWGTISLDALDLESAKAMFRGIARNIPENDPHLKPLLEAVSRVPICIDLLAHCSRNYQSLKPIADAWARDGVGLLRHGSRSLDDVLLLSLNSPAMTEEARRLFRLAAALPAGIAFEHLPGVFGGEDMQAANVLIDRGLARLENQRLALLQPVREWAVINEPAEDGDAGRAMGWFLDICAEHGANCGQTERGPASATILAPETPNLVWAVERARQREISKLSPELIAGLGTFFTATGHGEAGLLEAVALSLGQADWPAVPSALAWSFAADIRERRGELDEALRIRREKEIPVYERLGDVRSAAVAKGQIADVLQARGELDEALRILREEVLPVYERLGDVQSSLICKANIAIILLRRSGPGDREEAVSLLRAALADARRLRIPDAGQIEDILRQNGEEPDGQ